MSDRSPEQILNGLKEMYDGMFKTHLEDAIKRAFEEGERSAYDYVQRMSSAAKKLKKEKKHV